MARMIFMFCDLHVSLKNPSLADINSSNLSCLNFTIVMVTKTANKVGL